MHSETQALAQRVFTTLGAEAVMGKNELTLEELAGRSGLSDAEVAIALIELASRGLVRTTSPGLVDPAAVALTLGGLQAVRSGGSLY